MTKWQLIETAPKDGTKILIYEDLGWEKLIYVVRWVDAWVNPSIGAWLEADGEGHATYDPTHWMPLPEPPKETE